MKLEDTLKAFETDINETARKAVDKAVREAMRDHLPVGEYYTTKQASHYLGISPERLEIWRYKNEGPPYIKLARIVKYRRSDLDAFMNAHKRLAG